MNITTTFMDCFRDLLNSTFYKKTDVAPKTEAIEYLFGNGEADESKVLSLRSVKDVLSEATATCEDLERNCFSSVVEVRGTLGKDDKFYTVKIPTDSNALHLWVKMSSFKGLTPVFKITNIDELAEQTQSPQLFKDTVPLDYTLVPPGEYTGAYIFRNGKYSLYALYNLDFATINTYIPNPEIVE